MRRRTVDVLVVGAGLAGINAASRILQRHPGIDLELVERRAAIGGTWDLFRYPGVRSDSDMFTLAFPFHPWNGSDSIADGACIRSYLQEVVRDQGLEQHLTLRTRVQSADWSAATSRWTVHAKSEGLPLVFEARFLVMTTGYYDADSPYDPGFSGIDQFGGDVVHPQHWPEHLDVRGRRVAVIGSGATAISLAPAVARRGARVTMVQRTPSYVLPQSRRDRSAHILRTFVPQRAAHRVLRFRNTVLQTAFYRLCRSAPRLVRYALRRRALTATGSREKVDPHFDPPYAPWDQRLCIDADGELFDMVRDGSVTMVTGTVERFGKDGILLKDGRSVEADVVVTATGLSIRLFGGIEVSVEGRVVDLPRAHAYLGAMLSGVPNLAFSVGYLYLAWTTRTDLTARLVARVLDRLLDGGMASVVPVYPPCSDVARPIIDAPLGYLARSAEQMPRVAGSYPWTVKQNAFEDERAVSRAGLEKDLVWMPSRRGMA